MVSARPTWLKGVVTAALAGLLSQAALVWKPSLALAFFGRCAAQFAGLLTGCPVIKIDDGWLLPSATPAVVTAACSGTSYFLLMAVLLGWHLGRRSEHRYLPLAVAVAGATALAIAVNGLRIVAAIQASRWLNPLFPVSYGPILHMAVGVAVFLPALIATNLICEIHGRSRKPAGR